jgi:hypothetical protein
MNNLHMLVVASVLSVGIVTTSSLLLTTLNPQAATHLLLTVEIFSMFTGASVCVGAFSLLLDSLMTICAFAIRQHTLRFMVSKCTAAMIIVEQLGGAAQAAERVAQPAERADSCTPTDAACATPDASDPVDSADAGATGAGAGKAQDTGEISDDAASGADTV